MTTGTKPHAAANHLHKTLLALFGGLVLVVAGGAVVLEAQAEAHSDSPVAVFLGDSYTQGFGAVPLDRRWSSLVAHDADWTEVNQGQGGTGFVTTADKNTCGLEHCQIGRAHV